MGRVMRRVAERWDAAEPVTVEEAAATTTGVLMVSKPGSETTNVKLPAWGGTTWKVPSSPERELPATAPSWSSTKSTCAPGTMAPVGSATTPLTGGAEDGGAEAGLAAKRAGAAISREERTKGRIIQISRKRARAWPGGAA